ncbi:MAG: ATP-dependent Clp protease adaptor ClpS [Chloroflexi bacterium]|nr:ATP-dependent Clp protease adaptor ClpS [Chloroflexota bacterium]
MGPKTQTIPRIREDAQAETSEGPLYRVIIRNDNITPMDFVTHILITVFLMPDANAAYIMYTAHLKGAAYVQTLPKAEAQKRINRAHFAAAMQSYPLQFTLERE